MRMLPAPLQCDFLLSPTSIVARVVETLSQPVDLEVAGGMMPLTVAPGGHVRGLWRGLQMRHMAIFPAWSGRWDTMADAGRLTERDQVKRGRKCDLVQLAALFDRRRAFPQSVWQSCLVRQGCVAVKERSAVSGEDFGFRVAVFHRVCVFCPTLGGESLSSSAPGVS